MAISISQVLDPRHISLGLKEDHSRDAIPMVAELLLDHPAMKDVDGFSDSLLAREEIESTYMGHGIALPHARTNLVDDLVMSVGRCDKGVHFESAPDKVKLIFVIGTPVQLVQEYLAAVGCLARIIKEEQNRNKLFNAETPECFVKVIREIENNL
ncbi:MAG: PTS sugar transporter subunit IIA [Verrucomicrobiota bacterium]